jgi:hypothetical protein
MNAQRTPKPSSRLLRRAPSPLAGEGGGGGWSHSLSLIVAPPPGELRSPTSPARGEVKAESAAQAGYGELS